MSVVIPFLSRKVLFITGATGFLGKGTVEKILRHAPDVGRIYLMVRPRSRGAGKPSASTTASSAKFYNPMRLRDCAQNSAINLAM